MAGLTECYVLAIPFFQNSVISTLLYGFILFGSTKLFERYELVKVKA